MLSTVFLVQLSLTLCTYYRTYLLFNITTLSTLIKIPLRVSLNIDDVNKENYGIQGCSIFIFLENVYTMVLIDVKC